MFGNIELFRLSQAMATHASTRLGVIAQNVANADTPGYRGQDTVALTPDLDRIQASAFMRQTRHGHISSLSRNSQVLASQDTELSPNGNSVSVEKELLKAAQVQSQHDRALAVYKSALTILRTSIGRR